MKKTVTFLEYYPKLDFDTDNFKCTVIFSVIDTILIGTPREQRSKHSIDVVMTDILMANWDIPGALDVVITEEMIKVALQILEDYLVDELIKNKQLESTRMSIYKSTENSPKNCPYNIDNILYPNKTSFEVEIESHLTQKDTLSEHPNITFLLSRMENALKKKDYALVLHSSSCIFETLAKDIVAAPTIQNQTLNSFFERYRKDSNLPIEILNYIQSIYKERSTTPLAGHGSTVIPEISYKEAVTLFEMTKAFVKIEYQLRGYDIDL